MSRIVGVVTGTRAEYGLLYWLLREIQEEPSLELRLFVTGAHLSPEFGLTCREIERDGFSVEARVETLLSSDSSVGIGKSLGLGVLGFVDALDRCRPDLLVVLGDRYEVLAAAQAALVLRIPVAHLHGGERTEGVLDEAFRHAVTKMSQLHFVAAEPYRRRVIQLGEPPERVFLVGALGVDYLRRLEPLSREELEESLGFALAAPLCLLTYHPAGWDDQEDRGVLELLAALEEFPHLRLVATFPNADAGGRRVLGHLQDFAARRSETMLLVPTLGQRRYASLLRLADLVLGNSSSGILEAPSMGIPTVNIGERQRGRLRADSILDCVPRREDIEAAIRRALSEPFRRRARDVVSPYGAGGAARAIVEVLRSVSLGDLREKSFRDLPWEEGV